jgi:hypothetical protein
VANEIATQEPELATPAELTNTSIISKNSSMLEVGQGDGGLQTGEEAENARRYFLHQIGLKWDPFIMPVSEQELAFSGLVSKEQLTHSLSEDIFPLAYFVPPPNPVNPEQSLLSNLRQKGTAFVFGAPGSGKTSLRLALEASCRRVPDKTLAVSYLLGQDVAGVLTLDAHLKRLSQQLAMDAFIQVAEQYKPGIDILDEDQRQALAELIRIGGRPLQRLAERLISEPKPEGLWGLAERWRSVGRLPVRHVSYSSDLLALIKQAMSKIPATAPVPEGAAFSVGLTAAKQWGFQKVLVLVDGVDNWWREPDKILALIAPLLQKTAEWQNGRIYCKYFLPKDLQKLVEAFVDQNSIQFIPEPLLAILTWDKKALRRLLAVRFRAAGSRRINLDDLAGIELADKLDELLLTEAHGSPRRLLQLVSALIDVHVLNLVKGGGVKAKEHLITQEEWTQAVKLVARQFN